MEFLGEVGHASRRFEAPFEIKDRRLLCTLATTASPRIRKRPKDSDSGYAVGAHDPGDDRWLADMLELMMDHQLVGKQMEDLGKGNVQLYVLGYGVVKTVNINNDEVWVYRYRNQKGLPPPGTEGPEDDDGIDDGIEEIDLDLEAREDAAAAGGGGAVEVGEATAAAGGAGAVPAGDGGGGSGAAGGGGAGAAAGRSRTKVAKATAAAASDSEYSDDGEEYSDEEMDINILSSARVTGMVGLKRPDGSGVTVVMSVGDAGLLTGHKNGDVRLWVKGTNSPAKAGTKIGEHDGEVTCLAVIGHHAFTGSSDGSVRHWNTVTQQCEGVLPGHVGGVVCMCCADDKCKTPSPSVLIVAAADGGLRVWAVDREDYACLGILFCPDEATHITCMCIDPGCPCLYAAGNVTKTDKKTRAAVTESMVVCFSLVAYLKLYILRPEPPNKPALRRIPPPPPEPPIDMEELLEQDEQDDEIDLDAVAKDAQAALDAANAAAAGAEEEEEAFEEEAEEQTLLRLALQRDEEELDAVLDQAIEVELLTGNDAAEMKDRIEAGEETIEELTKTWLVKVEAEFTAKGRVWEAPIIPDRQAEGGLDLVLAGDGDDDTAVDTESQVVSKRRCCCGGGRREASAADKYAPSDTDELRETYDGEDGGLTYKVPSVGKPAGGEKQAGFEAAPEIKRRVAPKKKKTVTIERSQVYPHKGERLPMIARNHRLLIPGCLYSYELVVKNNSPNHAWLCVEDPQEPFTEFVMCDPSSANVRLAERLKPDGRTSYTLVWKVGVSSSDSAKLVVVLRAKVSPIHAKLDTPSFRMLFRGTSPITDM